MPSNHTDHKKSEYNHAEHKKADYNKTELKILLMQIRQDPAVAQEELQSFATYSGLDAEQIDVLDVFKQPSFDSSALEGYDSLWVGGASDANVLQPEKYPFVQSAKQLLLECCHRNLPVFASCFGFQLAVQALGGVVEDSNGHFEIGTIPISLAFNSKKDPLLKDTANPFMAVSVHKQKALKAPPNTQLLAYTETCVHGFKVNGKPFWAFQFHPEVDLEILKQRLTVYQDNYTENKKVLERVLQSAVETPDSNKLLQRFVDRVLLQQPLPS